MTLDARLLQSLFIAGTDTGVGKTWVATRLLAAWVAGRVSGGRHEARRRRRRTDVRRVCATTMRWRWLAAGNVPLPYEVLNPFCFPAPTSPHLAARDAGIDIDIGTISRYISARLFRNQI